MKAHEPITNSAKSIKRGLAFIYRIVSTPEGFDRYGSLSICCFALIGATSFDANLRQLARSQAQKLGQRWRRQHPVIPLDASSDRVLDFLFVRYALSRIGVRDGPLKRQIGVAVKRFSVQELLGFAPISEPPPNNLPCVCECGLKNPRGRSSCTQCRRRLETQSQYRVWMEALANAYVGERCGVLFGAGYLDVLKWLPAIRPYPANASDNIDDLRDAIYAVTHIVYTLNDYGTYLLQPDWLPQEFAFLQANVITACERKDPEVLGELLDCLKAFGLRASHPLITRGTRYLLTAQNEDGSWGDPNEENIRTRCHTTWTAIDGLRTYAWRGERSISPAVKSLL